ncbi:MAG: Fur family transcriptional regulator [Acidimicrobiia bacterium]
MHITAEDLIAVLRAEGLRITEPRQRVCTVIAERHAQHLTASAIHDAVLEADGGDLDVATVYRTLEVLEAAGAIVHGHIGHGPTVYHLADDADHQHLVCSLCGATTAIAADDIAVLFEGITSQTGFIPDIEHFALSGLCANCAGQTR